MEENPNEKKERIRNERNKTRDYMASKNRYLLTSRFNNSTFRENRSFINNKSNIGCVYCSPQQVSSMIPFDSVLFILEMNNDKNRIMGIGSVKNSPKFRKYRVYENHNYNRYVFTGKARIDREDMNEEEENVLKALDILCFKGNHHMKRGQGLLAFPSVMLYRISSVLDLVDFINNMFKRRNLFKKRQLI